MATALPSKTGFHHRGCKAEDSVSHQFSRGRWLVGFFDHEKLVVVLGCQSTDAPGPRLPGLTNNDFRVRKRGIILVTGSIHDEFGNQGQRLKSTYPVTQTQIKNLKVGKVGLLGVEILITLISRIPSRYVDNTLEIGLPKQAQDVYGWLAPPPADMSFRGSAPRMPSGLKPTSSVKRHPKVGGDPAMENLASETMFCALTK